jgi:hypothetical protein
VGRVYLRASAGQIERALDLLVRRALAATPHDGGTVRLDAWAIGDEAVAAVQAPEGARAPLGWGVRMASVARIAEMCGGRIVVSDESPSARMAVPLATPARRRDVRGKGPANHKSDRGRRPAKPHE